MFKNLNNNQKIIGLIGSLYIIIMIGIFSLAYSAPFSQNQTSFQGGNSYIIETVNIGVWNMDTTTTTAVATGIVASIEDVRVVDVWVLQDDESILYNLTTMQQTPQTISGTISDISTSGDGTIDVTFDRLSSGFFDENADFNDGTMNRGFITIIRAK